jgi:hypothetical protein
VGQEGFCYYNALPNTALVSATYARPTANTTVEPCADQDPPPGIMSSEKEALQGLPLASGEAGRAAPSGPEAAWLALFSQCAQTQQEGLDADPAPVQLWLRHITSPGSSRGRLRCGKWSYRSWRGVYPAALVIKPCMAPGTAASCSQERSVVESWRSRPYYLALPEGSMLPSTTTLLTQNDLSNRTRELKTLLLTA